MNSLRNWNLVIVALALACGARIQGADAAAARAAAVEAAGRSATGGYSGGVVPGVAVTDPATVTATVGLSINFGDGSPAVTSSGTGQEPGHVFPAAGNYRPSMTGSIGTFNLHVTVPFDPNAPDIFSLGMTAGALSEPVQVSLVLGPGSGTINFGDGSAPTAIGGLAGNSTVSHTYSAAGTYTAQVSMTNGGVTRTGSISYTIPLAGGGGKEPEASITSVTVTPNPAIAGSPVSFSGSIKATGGEYSGTLDYGDGSSESLSGEIANTLKGSLAHTYAADGIYEAVLTITGPATAKTSVFVIVGRGSVVNAVNGLGARATDSGGAPRAAGGGWDVGPRYTGGVTNLNIIPGRSAATSAVTNFRNAKGYSLASRTGLKVTNTFTGSGIFVAETDATAGTTSVGRVRKMLNVSRRDAGDSSALNDAPSANIVMTKMSGKLSFSGGTDKVSFSGKITLPAGLDPARADGNTVSVGIGNIIDTVVVDAKGKATVPGENGRITKLQIKYPKLSGAVTGGGETASIDVTMSVPNMAALGLDSEGITNSLRADERKLKAADRQIQIDVQLAGVAYEALAPAQYKLSKTDKTTGISAAGQFKGVPGRQPQTQ